MSPQRILGLLILVGGVILLIVGINASNSIADQVTNTWTGHFTNHTTWYIIGGIAIGIAGLSMMVFGPRGKNA